MNPDGDGADLESQSKINFFTVRFRPLPQKTYRASLAGRGRPHKALIFSGWVRLPGTVLLNGMKILKNF